MLFENSLRRRLAEAKLAAADLENKALAAQLAAAEAEIRAVAAKTAASEAAPRSGSLRDDDSALPGLEEEVPLRAVLAAEAATGDQALAGRACCRATV